MYRFFLFAFTLMFLISGLGFAQGLAITPFTDGSSWDIGAKAMALGGAFTGVSNDYSALYYNPAGLGRIHRTQIAGSFSHLGLINHATYGGVEASDEGSFTKMNSIGIAMPLPTAQGSLVLAFGYQRSRGFGHVMTSDVVPGVLIDPPVWVGTEVAERGIDFDADFQAEELQEGELAQTSLGVSVEVAPRIFVGGAINFWSGVRDYDWESAELGGVYDIDLDGDGTFETAGMISDFIQYNTYRETYTGVNLTLGALVQASRHLTLGGSLQTPVTLTAKRDWEDGADEWEMPGWEFLADSLYHGSESGVFDTKIQAPWAFRVGASLNVGPVLVSGDVEMKDYSQIRFKEAPAEAWLGTEGQANRYIRQVFRNTMNMSLGAQVTLPGTGISLRGGYAMKESPLKDATDDQNRTIMSVGAGYVFNDQLGVDVAFATTSWINNYLDDGSIAVTREKVELSKVLVSMIYSL